jgi:N12 class adenine-specific DNA methylase
MSVLDKAYQSLLQERLDNDRSRKKATLRAKQLTVAQDTADEQSGMSFGKTVDRALLGIEQGRQATVRGIPGFVLSQIPIDSVKETGRSLVDENIKQQRELGQAGELIGGGPLGTASQLFSNVGTQMVVPLGASRLAAKALGSTALAGRAAKGLSKIAPAATGESVAAVTGGAAASALQSGSGTYSDALEAYLGQGMDREQAESSAKFAAYLSGALTGIVTAGFGATGLEAVPKAFGSRPVREAIKEAIKQGGAEGTEETVDQIGQSIIQKLTYNPNLTFEQAVKEVGIAFAAGGVMGGALNAAANSIPALDQAVDIRNPRFDEDQVNIAGYLAERLKFHREIKLRFNPFTEPDPSSFKYEQDNFADDIQPDQRDENPTQGIGSLGSLFQDDSIYNQESDAQRVEDWRVDGQGQQPSNPLLDSNLLESMSKDAPIEAPVSEEEEVNPSALDDETALAPLENEIEKPEEVEQEQGADQPLNEAEAPKLQPAIETIPTDGIDKNFDWENEVPAIDAENNQVSLTVGKSWTDPVDPINQIHASALPFGVDVSGIGEKQAFLNFIQDPGNGQATRIGIGVFTPNENGSPQWVQVLTLEPGTPEFEQISNAVAGEGDSLTIPWSAINPSLINEEGSSWRQNDISKIGARPVNDVDEGMSWDDNAIKFHDLPDWLYEYRDLPPESWPTTNPMDVSKVERPEGLPEKLSEAYIDYVIKNDGNPEGWEQYVSGIIEQVKSRSVPEDLDKITKITTKQRVEYPDRSTGSFSFDIFGNAPDGKILLDQVGPVTYEKFVNWKIGGSGKTPEELDAIKYNARKDARIQKDLIVYAYNQLLAERAAQTKEGETDENNTGTEGLGERDTREGSGNTKSGSNSRRGSTSNVGGGSDTNIEPGTVGGNESVGDQERLPTNSSNQDNEENRGTEGTSDSRGRANDGVNGSDGTDISSGGTRTRGRGNDGLTEESTSSDSPVSPNAPQIKKIQRPNYRILNPEAIMGGGPKTRFNRNRQAIQIIDVLEAEGREPTSEELDILAGYSGWGSFGQELFKGDYDKPNFKEGWQKEGEWLLSHITKEEYESLQTSIENSHYTDPPTVQAMWALVEKLGFKGGRILEPSVGSGNFLGLMPENIEKHSQITGLELDVITSKLAKILYPQSNIQNKRYELSKTADNFYDLVIGNWPFSPAVPFDPRYQKIGAVTHDYFFIKALDQVRPGGIVIGITSNGTMDKSSPYSRKAMARKGELIAAFRLPTGAFKEYAGTSVVTDILIFKKREKELEIVDGEGWINTEEIKTPSGEKIKVNEYYASNSGNVLGTLDYGHGTTSNRPGMIVHRPDNLRDLLSELPGKIQEGIAFEPWEAGKKFEGYIQKEGVEGRQGSTILKDGEFYVISGEHLAPLKWSLADKKQRNIRFDQIKRLIGIRETLSSLIQAQTENSDKKEELRAQLNKEYDEFVKSHGFITDSDGIKTLTRAKDPGVVELSAIENVQKVNGELKITKAGIFSKDTVRAPIEIVSPTLGDSFAIERARTLDLDYDIIAERAGISREQAIQQLVENDLIYKNEIGEYEAADVFLSGNVRVKLRQLLEAQSQGVIDLEKSIEAIKAIIPKTIPYYAIEPQLGATYVATSYYADFIADLVGADLSNPSESVSISKLASGWKFEFGSEISGTDRANDLSVDVPRRAGDFIKLLTAAFNSKTVRFTNKVRHPDGTTETVFLEEETARGNEIIEQIRDSFTDWIWKDPNRRDEVQASYNEMRNSFVIPTYDGSHLSFPGLAIQKGNEEFEFRKHQINATWRGIVSGRSLNAHEVGTGKTGVIAALAMASRQFGLARKPMIWAHNANAHSLYEEFIEMYPGAKVLFVDNLDQKNKIINLNKIKMDDWDAVIIPHSMTANLNLRPETVRELVQRDLDALAVAIEDALSEDGGSIDGDLDNLTDEDVNKIRNPTAKQLVRQRNKLLERVRKSEQLAENPDSVFFEDLGIDTLLVDEAHEFKKIPLSTSQTVKGLNKSGSERGTSLLYLSEYLRKQNNGKGIHLFTGTPITNTLNEVYNMMRFVMSDIMDNELMYEWDDWFKSFSTTTADIELNSAAEWEVIDRIKSFINLPELKQMFGQYMDVVFAKDMVEFAPRAEREGRMENPKGRPYMQTKNVISQMTPIQAAQTADQKERYKQWKQLSGAQKRDAMKNGSNMMPIVIESDGSKTAIDARMNNLSAPAEDGGKVDKAVNLAMEHYRNDPGSTQMFFMEVGLSDFTERSTGIRGANGKMIKEKVPAFNLAKDIKKRLMEQGVPESEIFIFKGIKGKKKAEIAEKINSGEIRFAIGSTATMGTGVNAQKNLRAIHHLDAPYMPGSFEQRNGRILRQGNTWNTVYEYRYITSRSLDARRWQIMLTKHSFIKKFMDPAFKERSLEGDATNLDEEGSAGSFEETFSEAAGDSRIMRRTKLQKEVEKLIRSQRIHLEGIIEVENRIKYLESRLPKDESTLADYRKDFDHYRVQDSENFVAYLGVGDKQVKYDKKSKFDEAIKEIVSRVHSSSGLTQIGRYKGFDILVQKYQTAEGFSIKLSREGLYNSGGLGNAALENTLKKIEASISSLEATIQENKARIINNKAELTQPFPKQKQLDSKKAQLEEVINSLATSPNPPPEWLLIGAPSGTSVYDANGNEFTVEGHKSSDRGFFVIGQSGDNTIDLPYQSVFNENGSKIYSSPEDLGIGSSDQTNDQAQQARIDSVLLQAVGHTAISQLISNPASGLSKRQVELANLLLNQIPAEFLSNLNLSISNPASGLSNQQVEFLSGNRFSVSNTVGQSNLQGSFSYLLNQANIFTGATNPTVAIEEIVHSLAKFLPENIRMGLEEDWKQKISDAQGSISENADEVDLLIGQILQEAIDSNGISTTRFMEILEASDVLDQQAVIDRAYPLINLDEYFAHGVSNKFSDIKIPKGIIDKSVEFLRSLWDVVKRFFGLKNQDLFDQIISKFKKGEFSPDVDNGMLFESNVRIPAGAIAAFNKTEMAQQIVAAKEGLSEVNAFRAMESIGSGVSPAVQIFKKYTKGVSPNVLNKIGTKDSMEVEADIVAAIGVIPSMDEAVQQFEADGHPELGRKLQKETWEGLNALNRKFENVAQKGSEAAIKLGSGKNLKRLKSEIENWNAKANKEALAANEFEALLESAIEKNLEIIKSETASLTRKDTAKDLQGRLNSLKGANERVAKRVDDYMSILMQDPEFVNQAVFKSPKVTGAWVKSLLQKVKIPRGQGIEQNISRIAIRLIATNEGIRKAYAAAQFDKNQSNDLKRALSYGEIQVLRAMSGKSKVVSIASFLQKLSRKSASAAQAAVILEQKVKRFTNEVQELMTQAEAGVVASRIISDPEWSQLLRGLGDPIKAIITPTLKGKDDSLSDPESWDSTTYVPIPENSLGQASKENLIPLKLSSSDYRMVDADTWSKNFRDLEYARDRIAIWLAENQGSIYAPYYDRWYKMLSSFYLSDVIYNPPAFVNKSSGLNSLLALPIAMLEGMGIRSAQVARILGKQWERVHTMSTKLPDIYKARWTNLVRNAMESHFDDSTNITNSDDRKIWMTKVYSYLADSWQGGKKPFKVGDILPSGEKVTAEDMAVVDLLSDISKKLVDMTNAIEPNNPEKRVGFGAFSDGTRVTDTDLSSDGVIAKRGIINTAKKMLGRTLSSRGVAAAEFFGSFWGWNQSEKGTWNYERDWLNPKSKGKTLNEDNQADRSIPKEVQEFINKIDDLSIDKDIVMSTLWDRGAETSYSASMLTRQDGLESVYPTIVRDISNGTLPYSGSDIVRRIVELNGDITEAEAAARFARDMQNAWKPLWKDISDQKKGINSSNHTEVIKFLESNNFTLGRKDKKAPSIAYAYGAEDEEMFRVMAHNAGSDQYNQFQKALEAVEDDLKTARRSLGQKADQTKGQKGIARSDALREIKENIKKRAQDPKNISDVEIAEEIDTLLNNIGMIKQGVTDVYSSGGQDIKAQYGPMAFTYNRLVGAIITPTIGQIKTLARNYWEYTLIHGELHNKLSGTSLRGYVMAFKALFAPSIKAGFRVGKGGVVGFGKGAKLGFKHFGEMLDDLASGKIKAAKTKGAEGVEAWFAEIFQEAASRALYNAQDMKRLNDLGLAQVMDIPSTLESLRTMPGSGGVIRDVSGRGAVRNGTSWVVNALLSAVEYVTTPTLKSLLPRMADESMNAASISLGIGKVQEYQTQLLKTYLRLKSLGKLDEFDFENPYSQKNADLFLPEYMIQGRGLFAKTNLKTAYDQARLILSNAQVLNAPAEAVKYWGELRAAEQEGTSLTKPQFLTDGERSSVGYEFATYANAPTALNRNISLKRYGSLGRSIALLGGYPMTLLSRISTSAKRSVKDPSYNKMLMALSTAFLVGIGLSMRGLNEILLQIFNREAIDPFQGEEKKARMFWEEGTTRGQVYNLAQQVGNQIPFIGTVAMNMLLTDQPTRNELEPFGLLKDKAGDTWNYIAGALRTGDPAYNFNNTLKSFFPMTKPVLNRLPGASGISEHMNVKRLASIYAPEDLRRPMRGYVSGGTTATALSPYGLKILNAIMNEDNAEAKTLFNEAIEVAMRTDGDTYSRAKERIEQKVASMNPWRQRLKRTPTYSERQMMLDKMTSGEQEFILQAEQKLARGTSALGVNINFYKQGTEVGKITKKIRQRNQSRFSLSNPWSSRGFGNMAPLTPMNPFR